MSDIVSKPSTPKYRENYEKIFGERDICPKCKKMRPIDARVGLCEQCYEQEKNQYEAKS
jgi:hypothetical protein